MDQSYAVIDARIDEAVGALSDGLYPSVTATARDFDVSARRLQRMIVGSGSLSSRSVNNKFPLDSQELATCGVH